ncbi:NADH-quinone oxidoreductase subunit A [Candidatus Frackibacter sp. WG12]|uniref:NADH-quinone oxidoreductase subunit A n=2 Tax=unclassified Candidatus Frackibacter TaxID=2648818 RepID=UPI00088C05F8|nr:MULTISPECIES: NADH-quinone oxidoreductase subunit A [unclassified Candidatus Frackibacter]SDC80639.1 NADH-quinone oxidoreductase subunit A [Candidatus Frackibacter sp. WG11]SEM93104.1 NADH-quinone oxidoreductase subunit A [Candidatus Frackibacter sp. WG12]SFM02772.1 NADH-quinone oxidoreductase subunit A [Candidatus Frackibacter sp. WG13]
MYEFNGIVIFFILGLLMPIGALIGAYILAPTKSSPQKYLTYECGLDTRGETWVQFKICYFLYALVFLVFDVETIFLYPWAVTFQQLGTFAFVEMFIFIAILIIGFVYAWKEGALEWF